MMLSGPSNAPRASENRLFFGGLSEQNPRVARPAELPAQAFAGGREPLSGGVFWLASKIPRPRDLKAHLLNVIYPSYQAVELFGRRKRSGLFDRPWFGRVREQPARFFLVSCFSPGGSRDSQSSFLRHAGRRRLRHVHEHLGEGLRWLCGRLRRWL
jgi:hypothetical protein